MLFKIKFSKSLFIFICGTLGKSFVSFDSEIIGDFPAITDDVYERTVKLTLERPDSDNICSFTKCKDAIAKMLDANISLCPILFEFRFQNDVCFKKRANLSLNAYQNHV